VRAFDIIASAGMTRADLNLGDRRGTDCAARGKVPDDLRLWAAGVCQTPKLNKEAQEQPSRREWATKYSGAFEPG
jgi:hypothetical protein